MFDGQVYQQVHGTAMGSPVSVVVAILVMEKIEERALSSVHTPPWFWRRYIDDTCTAFSQDLLASFHEHLNSIDQNIQFTVEESSGQMPFLDAFGSLYPMAHKRAVVRTLMHQGEALCSQVYVEPRKKSKKHWKRMATRLLLCRGSDSPRQTRVRDRQHEHP